MVNVFQWNLLQLELSFTKILIKFPTGITCFDREGTLLPFPTYFTLSFTFFSISYRLKNMRFFDMVSILKVGLKTVCSYLFFLDTKVHT